MRHRLSVVSGLRLDARLFDPAPPRRPGTIGRPRVVGQRQSTLARRLADARTSWQATTVAGWYGGKDRRIEIATGTAVWHHPGLPVVPLGPRARPRAQVQVAGVPLHRPGRRARRHPRLVRAPLGDRDHVPRGPAAPPRRDERQRSDRAIARTTPVLLEFYSLVILWAHDLRRSRRPPPSTVAWYPKERATFGDALASVRRALWADAALRTSRRQRDLVEVPRPLLNRLTTRACYAA